MSFLQQIIFINFFDFNLMQRYLLQPTYLLFHLFLPSQIDQLYFNNLIIRMCLFSHVLSYPISIFIYQYR